MLNKSLKHKGEKASNGVTRDSSQRRKAGKEQKSPTFSTPSRKGHVVIDIDDIQDVGSTQEPSYVEAYMKIMFWMCVSPFNPITNLGENTTSLTDLALKLLQKVRNLVF